MGTWVFGYLGISSPSAPTPLGSAVGGGRGTHPLAELTVHGFDRPVSHPGGEICDGLIGATQQAAEDLQAAAQDLSLYAAPHRTAKPALQCATWHPQRLGHIGH